MSAKDLNVYKAYIFPSVCNSYLSITPITLVTLSNIQLPG